MTPWSARRLVHEGFILKVRTEGRHSRGHTEFRRIIWALLAFVHV